MECLLEPVNYERVVLLANPQSTNAHLVHAERAALDDMGLDVLPLETCREVPDMRAVLQEVLLPGDVVFAHGGDRTAAIVGAALLGRSEPMAPRPGGNACDLVNMLVGDSTAEEILLKGRQVELRPLDISVEYNRVPVRTIQALGYFSLGNGGTPEAALEVDKLRTTDNPILKRVLEHKWLRLAYEGQLSLRTVAKSDEFMVWDEGSDEPQWVGGRLFAKGHTMAKKGRLHARLTEPEMEVIDTPPPNIFNVTRDMTRLALGRLHGRMVREEEDKPAEVKFQVATKSGDPLLMQCDGDVWPVPSGSTVTAGLAAMAYRALTTCL